MARIDQMGPASRTAVTPFFVVGFVVPPPDSGQNRQDKCITKDRTRGVDGRKGFFLLTQGDSSGDGDLCGPWSRAREEVPRACRTVGVSLHLGKDECLTFLERIEFLLYRSGIKVIAWVA